MLLLDWYGHFQPSEHRGFADALTAALDRPQTAPRADSAIFRDMRRPRTQAPTRDCVAPRAGLEPATRRLEGALKRTKILKSDAILHR